MDIELDEEDPNSEWLMIHEQLARIGGSMAGVFSVGVDGWVCAMKCIPVRSPEDLVAVETEIHMLESLPPHPNVVRYARTLVGRWGVLLTRSMAADSIRQHRHQCYHHSID
jgi:hypothetical protein